MSDWGAPDVIKWKEEARAQQQDMFLRLGDREWDEWDRSDTTILQRKVGFGMYGLPGILPESNNNFTGYEKEQFEKIKLAFDVIERNAKSGSIMHFACIFVFGKIWEQRFSIPVFKVKGEQDETVFVDSDCRVYKSWSDYLNSNKLPKCMYCYPLDGLYQGNEGQAIVEFGTSPACDLVNRIFSFFDSTATVVNLATTSVMVASIFTVPIATPILAMAGMTSFGTGVYGATRSATSLVDRYAHDQSIGLDDSEARMAWIGIAGSALGMAQSRMFANISKTAAAGEISTKALRITYNVVTVGSLTVNGLGTLNGFILLVDKADKGTLTPLDVFHFSASLLFFSNSLFNADTARGVIENTQKQVLNHHCDDLTAPQIEELFKLSDQVQGKTQMHKNANKIKAINHIGDKQAFYESLVSAKNDLEGHKIQFSFEELGLININKELNIAPNKLVQISPTDRQVILDATQKVNDGALNDAVYRKNVETVLKNNRIKMQYQRIEAIAQLKEAFNTDNIETVEIGNKQIFKNMTPSELDRLANVMAGSGKNYDPKILRIANEFAQMRGCKTPRDYSNYVEFTAKYLSDLKNQKEAEYQMALRTAGSVDPSQFARDYGIEGKRANYFTKQIFDNFDTNRVESFAALEQQYSHLESHVLPLNANMTPNFASDTAAVYHYFKHSDFGSEHLTPEKYFEIASELVNEPLNRCYDQLNQQGTTTRITFTNPIRGAKGVVFESLADGTRSLATVFYDKKVLNQK